MQSKKTVKASKKKTGAGKKPAAAKKGGGARRKAREVRVRMYRQGLGDCFLLTFPRDPEPFHMLVDCGALKSKHYGNEQMKAVVGHIRQTLGDEAAGRARKKSPARLDVVAGTHEHWDHISGFWQAREIFDELDVKKVWVAWTEEPENEVAKRLKKEFKKKKTAVANAMALIPENKKSEERLGVYRAAISELFGFFGGLGADAASPGGTQEAWDYMLGLGRKEYCDPKKTPLEIEGVEGARVYILGPPEDPDYIRRKLSKTETYDEGKHGLSLFDSFMAAVGGDDVDFADDRKRALPFDEYHRVEPDAARGSAFFQRHYGFDEGGEDEWRRIDHDWLNMAGQLALHLDSYTNNTCLAFAVELGEPGEGKVLLFPGDAQVGNWLSWGELTWQVKNSKGEKREVTAEDLLGRTVLYKVGHHGSHNATMRRKGLEMMKSPELVAMIPVHRPTAEDQKWEFPYRPLWEALKRKARGRVLLADAPDMSEIESEIDSLLSADERRSFEKATTFDDLYVEYRVRY
ncbi:MAG TPA: hypothetical protein VGB98_14285 [Pyrinomonadaceae bacterium]|jgi:hypothetical protein